jgi:hypothetical protein
MQEQDRSTSSIAQERVADEQAQTKRQITGIENLVGEKSFLFPGPGSRSHFVRHAGERSKRYLPPIMGAKLQHASAPDGTGACTISSRRAADPIMNFETPRLWNRVILRVDQVGAAQITVARSAPGQEPGVNQVEVLG